jgi:charged multivesicular body protein 7
MASTTSIYHTDGLAWRMAGFVVGKPLWWALEQLNLVGEGSDKAPTWKKVAGDYVFVETLEVSFARP